MITQQPYQPQLVNYRFANGDDRGLHNMPYMGMGSGMGSGMMPPQVTSGSPITPSGNVTSTTPPVFEQSYVENILRANLGKTGTFYMTYENNSEWNAKIFKGVVEAAGRDHIIISDRATGKRYLLLTLNLDYVTFDEPLNYSYPGVIGTSGQGSR
ncbi:MAG TPA: spore coat protein GerQ [Paenibacillus sp.]